jgi:hypothetical protein
MSETMELIVAPAREVKRDFRGNLPWIAALLLITLVFVL